MSGIFGTFNTASKGLIAQQTALHTTSHNISNANTEGYSRQRVDLKADIAYNFAGVGQLGTGVKMTAVVRLVDDFVTKQIRKENSTLEKFSAKSEVLEQVEIIFNEPSDTGLNFNMGEMFNSWQELSKNPESSVSKTIVVEKAKTLADTLNHISSQLNSLSDDTTGQIQKGAYDFNSIVSKLDSLNQQIFNVSVKGDIPNDLLDQRDVMLKDLSSISNFDASFDQYGKVKVSIDGQEVLGDNANYEMSMISDVQKNADDTYTVSISKKGDSLSEPLKVTVAATDKDKFTIGQVIVNKKTGIETGTNLSDLAADDVVWEPSITSGQIKGYTDALSDITDRKANLNIFAKTMANAINKVHRYDGITEKGNEFNFFDIGDGPNYADDIKVNPVILTDNSKVNVGFASTSPEGDGSRALAIASLRNTKLSIVGDSSITYDPVTMKTPDHPGGITIEGIYNDIVTKVGISKEHSDNMVANQETLVDQLQLRRESTSGVSIDEEVTNLIKFQKSYEANAKVISILAEMLDTLINRMGV